MLEKRQLIVVHFSCGAASAVAAYKTKRNLRGQIRYYDR